MSDRFSEIFKVGGKVNTLGRSAEVLDAVNVNKSRLPELYECLRNDDAWVRMRAADTLEKVCRIHPYWLETYTDDMINNLTVSTQPSIQWHLVQIFRQISLSKEQKVKVVYWISELLKTVEVDWIVSANAMDALVQYSKDGYLSRDDLIRLLDIQLNHKSKAVVKRAKKLISNLNS